MSAVPLIFNEALNVSRRKESFGICMVISGYLWFRFFSLVGILRGGYGGRVSTVGSCVCLSSAVWTIGVTMTLSTRAEEGSKCTCNETPCSVSYVVGTLEK
jgi:hypothetical protein